MTCVLWPVAYNQTWKRSLPLIRLLIIFLPIGGTWNLWISKVFPVQQYGGLALSYSRNVHWPRCLSSNRFTSSQLSHLP
ncbi:Protein CBG20989 [Caenorhabditis briggsae]|uniref:Serpentine receptor class gamma n=1 Tax=Caenorhabditis briggsae TaxID=6238 RepID=A8XZ42_CAEBR|nr:Protein CBG20989 [Caenorhabditis briggsae]CAP37909.1 Protein CBG20989 [Caenorhabditis briggsae]